MTSPDIPPQAITAAALRLKEGHERFGIRLPANDRRTLAAEALEAAAPHIRAEMPTGIIRIEDGKLTQAELEELAERWKAAWHKGEYTILSDDRWRGGMLHAIGRLDRLAAAALGTPWEGAYEAAAAALREELKIADTDHERTA